MPPILVPCAAKQIATQVLVIAKRKKKNFFLEALFVILSIPTRSYLFKGVKTAQDLE